MKVIYVDNKIIVKLYYGRRSVNELSNKWLKKWKKYET